MTRYMFAMVVVVTLALPGAALGQLYSEDFEVDPTADWTVNDGPTDEYAEFFYDYGTNMGIPQAPNSAGGTTRGMRLRANLINAVFGGFSVSPTGQSFTGDYKVSFDLWHNYIGAFGVGVSPIGTTTGSTMLSTFGIQSSGTSANYAGASDGLFFATTGDVSSSAYRAYSIERAISYQLPFLNPEVDIDGMGNPIDSHATYHAGTRSNNPSTGGGNEVYYQNAFPSVTVPAAQTAIYPDYQFGNTQPGAIGFAWHEVEIKKVGTTVTWTVDGTLLMTVETENFVTPAAGTNILFGHSDINAGVSLETPYLEVAFTLIDNIVVEAIDENNGDYNGDGFVDAADYPVWRKSDGTQAGYDAWVANFGTAVGSGSGALAAVPEPATFAFAAFGLLALGIGHRRRP